jgi:probable phosphoglycerate mutase
MQSKFSNGFGSACSVATQVILVRHGQSTVNAQARYQGRGDRSVLTEQGRSYAEQTAVALKRIAVDAIYTSPLKCSLETAIVFLSAMNPFAARRPSIHIDRRLREIDLPAWQGLPFPYVQEQFATDYRCGRELLHQFEIKSYPVVQAMARGAGEVAVANAVKQKCFPVLDLYAQAQQFWQEMLPRHVGQTVIIFSHSDTNRALISTALGLSPQFDRVLQQCNCGISILNFPARQPQLAQLVALNLTTHLGETLPQLNEGKQGLRLLLVPSDRFDLPQVQQLAEFLRSAPIDFSLSTDLDWAQKTAELILQYHPTTVQLQVLRQDFAQVWQQTIYSRRSLNSSQLLTGLVVSCEPMIKSILGQVLGMESEQLCRLGLTAGAISAIHYPSVDSPPVLQAMNLADSDILSILRAGAN